MIDADDIVLEARRWIGTPYHLQARRFGIGCDCLGLVIEVGKRFGLLSIDYNDYSATPDGVTLEARCDEHLIRDGVEPSPGRIGLFWISRRLYPQHLAIFCGRKDGTFGIVHAHQKFDRVVEHRFDDFWRKRLVAVFAFPGIE